MIGFFTIPYPDELLYSVYARYSHKVKYTNKKSTFAELLGNKSASSILDFPNRLNYLISILPSGNKYSADRFINENTLFPFYSPFFPLDRAKLILREMKGNAKNNLRSRTATIIKQIRKPNYLRFCPECVASDRNKYGETYWHRLHQLPGILVCSIHFCFLENSLIERDREIGNNFFPADQSTFSRKRHYLKQNDVDHQQLLNLALDARWLISQKSISIENSVIREKYYNQLLKNELAYYNGRIKNNLFYKAFKSFYSTAFLNNLGCEIESSHRSWIFRLLEKSQDAILHHPIKHLLMIHFLGYSVQDFFTSFVEFKPFVDGPYPCLSRAADHYGELTISKCKIFDNLTKGRRGKPIAQFSCHCGFVYQRVGSDQSEDDRFRYDSIREYGANWENKLKEMWNDLSLSRAEIARRLQVSEITVANTAYRLNFPMNTPDTRISNDKAHRKTPRRTFTESKKIYREKMLKIVRENPDANRKKLINLANFEYLWLMRNDSEWLLKHLPKVSKKHSKKEFHDWIKIDDELSILVRDECDQLYSINPPKRVSITEVIRRIGHKNWLDKCKIKLPKTTKVLDKNLETLEAFMLRKLLWAEEHFVKENHIPSYNQLVSRAVIKNQTTNYSKKVQNGIRNSLERIKKKCN